MRTYRIEVNERSYTVSLEQIGGDRFKATVNDETFETHLLENAAFSTWLVSSGGDVVHAKASKPRADKVDVWLAGVPFLASIEAVGTAGFTIVPTRERHVGGEIRALMPGRITSILVKEGESVDEGTPLLILEAMKMQNEIVAPIAGTVKSIQVGEGAAVKKDSLLIIVE